MSRGNELSLELITRFRVDSLSSEPALYTPVSHRRRETVAVERVLVTGGSGRLGRAVVRELVENGYEVVAVDRVHPKEQPPEGARFVETDLGDVGQVAGAAVGCDALVHLGAIPAPYAHPDEIVFRNNTGATFAVFQAVSLLGIKRVAFASSVSAYGSAWANEPFPPVYVLVDEAHPMLNHDAYGLSKEVDERTAQMFSRRDRMSVAALRFHWIATREEQLASVTRHRAEPEWVESARTMWGYVDLRDAARACRLAIEATRKQPFEFETFNIVASDTLIEEGTEAMVRQHAPSTQVRTSIPGNAGAYDVGKARRLLGWEPMHSWRHDGKQSGD